MVKYLLSALLLLPGCGGLPQYTHWRFRPHRALDVLDQGMRWNGLDPNGFGALVIPGHFFMLVEKTPAGVSFHWLNSDWLRGKVIEPKGPAHAMARGKPVLTADSARLNAFLGEFGLDPKAVSGSMIFNRLKQN